MKLIKFKKKVISLFLTLFLFPLIASSQDSIKYNFSVQFFKNTCDVETPESIILSKTPDAGVVSSIDIKNDSVNIPFTIGLQKCTSKDLSNVSIYISQGNTLADTTDFFNNKADGNIGVQIRDVANNRVFSVNTSNSAVPNPNSIVWDNIKSEAEKKQLTASLRCKTENCEPDIGSFTASVTLSYYVN